MYDPRSLRSLAFLGHVAVRLRIVTLATVGAALLLALPLGAQANALHLRCASESSTPAGPPLCRLG